MAVGKCSLPCRSRFYLFLDGYAQKLRLIPLTQLEAKSGRISYAYML